MVVKSVPATPEESKMLEQAIEGGQRLVAMRLAQGKTFTPPRKTQKQETKEPQMRALRRILGDSVLEIIPEGVRSAVDASYKFWQEHPDSYQDTPMDSAQEREDALLVMRAYAEMAGDDGYTIRTVNDEDPAKFYWRAQNRRTASKGE